MKDISLAGNLTSWQSTGERRRCATSTPTAHTFFSCAFCQRACPSLLSQLSFRLQSSRHALTSRTCAAQAQHEALRTVSCPKIVTSHRAQILFSVSFNPAPIYVNLSVVRLRNSHPSQCVDGMVAPGGYALPSGPGHVHVDWTLNCTEFTPRHGCRCAYKYGLGATIGPQFKDSVWSKFMELWSRAAFFVTPWCLKKDEPSGVNLEWYAAWGSFSCGTAITNQFRDRGDPKVIASTGLESHVAFRVCRRARQRCSLSCSVRSW